VCVFRDAFLGSDLEGLDLRGEDRDLEGQGSVLRLGGWVWVWVREKPRVWVYFFLSFPGSE